jgi:hypothetical protein
MQALALDTGEEGFERYGLWVLKKSRRLAG